MSQSQSKSEKIGRPIRFVHHPTNIQLVAEYGCPPFEEGYYFWFALAPMQNPNVTPHGPYMTSDEALRAARALEAQWEQAEEEAEYEAEAAAMHAEELREAGRRL